MASTRPPSAMSSWPRRPRPDPGGPNWEPCRCMRAGPRQLLACPQPDQQVAAATAWRNCSTVSSSAGLNGRIARIIPLSSGPKKFQPRATALSLTRISTLRRSAVLGWRCTCPAPSSRSMRAVVEGEVSPSCEARLARTATGLLIADDYTVEEQFAPPDAPRFAAVESIGQAGGPGRAVPAQCLRTDHVAGQFSEEQVRIGAARQRSRHTSTLAGAPARPHRSAG